MLRLLLPALLPLLLATACTTPEPPVRCPEPCAFMPGRWTDLPVVSFDIPPHARFLEGLTICLDPGHGGDAHRKGYKRTRSGFREAIMNWRVAGYLKEFLEEAGAKVVLTRQGDVAVSLARRAAIALESRSDIFLSLHHNAVGKPAVNRTTVWYHGDDDWSPASLDAARCVYWGLVQHMRLAQISEVPLNSDKLMYKSGFGVLRGIKGRIPALLTESSFFTNPEEEKRLRDPHYNRREAYGIFMGLVRWAFHGLARVKPVDSATVPEGSPLRFDLDSGLARRRAWSASRPHVLASSVSVTLDGQPWRQWRFAYPRLTVLPPAGGWGSGAHRLKIGFVNLFKNSPVNPVHRFKVLPADKVGGRGLRLDVSLDCRGGKAAFRIGKAWIDPQFSGPPPGALAPDTGSHRYRLVDAGTGKTLWRLGFSSLLDEWLTLPRSRKEDASFPHTLRVPLPAGPAHLVVERRRTGGAWEELGRYTYRPDTPPPAAPAAPETWRENLRLAGPPASTLDMLVVGDGYTRQEMALFRRHATRAVSWLKGDLARDVSIRLVAPPAAKSGPGAGSPIGCRFNSMGMARYLLPTRHDTLAALTSHIPADVTLVVVNTGRYGGGGVHNLYAVFSGGLLTAPLIAAHETGHLLAGLGDEYVGTVTYEDAYAGREPWEPNLTRVTDPKRLKWRALLTPKVPIPTPDKARYAKAVGLFEGAGYQAKGIYRPCRTCIMRRLDAGRYCPVCSRAMRRMIDFWVKGR